MAGNTSKATQNTIFPLFDEAKRNQRNIAIAVDGGGIKGTMVAKALDVLEQRLISEKIITKNLNELVRMFVGTSTGSILAAALAKGIGAGDVFKLYESRGPEIFSGFFNFSDVTKYGQLLFKHSIYTDKVLRPELEKQLVKDTIMRDFWEPRDKSQKDFKQIDLIMTTLDLRTYRSRFIKPYNKPKPKDIQLAKKLGRVEPDFPAWKVVDAVLASCAVPLYFPMVSDGESDSDYADGGVGAYGNPSYLAAYEINKNVSKYIKDNETGWAWDPQKTTLISIGTGKPKTHVQKAGDWKDFGLGDWIDVIVDGFGQSTSDQQKALVEIFKKEKGGKDKKEGKNETVDYRRFQIDFGVKDNLTVDDYEKLLRRYEEKMNEYIEGKLKEASKNGKTSNVDPEKFRRKLRSALEYDFNKSVGMDNAKEIPILSVLGLVLGDDIVHNRTEQ